MMNRTFLIAVMLSMLCIHATIAADIGGMVTDYTGQRIAGAVVRLESTALADTTDNVGRFLFEGIGEGRHVLAVDHPGSGYVSVRRQVEVPDDTADQIILVLGPRTYQADEVVVVAPRQSNEGIPEDTPAQVTVISRAEFENQAVTVADVIEATPGAVITTTGGLGSFSEVSLRGTYSNQVQVFIDGMLLNDAAGSVVNLSTIPLSAVERIEVWRSGAPAGFGGDAVGGAINIVTRDTGGNERSASLEYGSFNTVAGHGIIGFGNPESRMLVSLDAAISDNDYEYTSDNGTPQNPDDDYTADRQNDGFKTVNAMLKYRGLMGRSLLFELSEQVLSSSKELPAIQHIGVSDASLENARNLLQARLTWQPSKAPWLTAAPAFHSIITRERYRDPSGTVGWGAQDNRYDTRSFEGVLPVSFAAADWGELTLTPLAKHETYRPEHTLDTMIPLSCDREQLALTTDAILHTPGRRAVITATLRRDRYFNTYEGQASRFSLSPPDPQFHHFTTSRAGIRLALHEYVSVSANYGDLWRAPGFFELFGDRGATVASFGLSPEHIFTRDAGIRLHLPGSFLLNNGMVEAVWYEHTFRDLIQWYTNNYGFTEPSNVAGSYLRGTEIVWSLLMPWQMSISGSWTFQDSKVTDSAHSYHQGRKLPNRPDHYGTVTAEYTHGRYTLFWHMDHRDTYFLDRANQDHRRYPGRTLHDAGLRMAFADGRAGLRLQVTNIGDERTFDVLGMPRPGRSFLMALEYRR